MSLGDIVVDYAVLRADIWGEEHEVIETPAACPTDEDHVEMILNCRTGRKTRAGLQDYTLIFEDGLPRAVRNGVPGGKFWPSARLRNFGGYDLRQEDFEKCDSRKFMEMYAQAMPVIAKSLRRAYAAADEGQRRALRKAVRYGAGLDLEEVSSSGTW
jgi:hypothetical protein